MNKLTEFDWIIMGSSTGLYEHSNELSSSIQIRNFFTSLKTITFQGRCCTMELVNTYIIKYILLLTVMPGTSKKTVIVCYNCRNV